MKKILLLALFLLLATQLSFADQEIIDVPLIGEYDVSQVPLLVSTILIAAVDGVNPCSIWVLLFLLGMVLHTGSRRKILLVGSVFLLVTATIYGVFIAGVFTIFTFMNQIQWIIYIVAGLALLFGIVNIKDYFWFKKGLSFTISDKYKPKLFKQARGLIKTDNTWFLIGATIVMAAGIAIIELPCTAGLPVIWSGLLASSQEQIPFLLYLFVYVFIYLLIEIIILVSVVITLRSIKMDEFKGRALKLIGGVLITALAIILLWDRTLMYSIGSVFAIIFGALLISILIIAGEILWRRR
ncbi:MAG: hypothetical protein ACMXYF_04500 [Candidatus Woesearchaeota archaeon]